MEREHIITGLTGVRNIFLKSLAFIVAAGIASFVYSKEMLLLLVRATGIKVYYLTIQEVFLATVQLALFAGIFFAVPVVIFLVWYEMRGIYRMKPFYGYLLVLAAVILFYGGSLFCYKIVLPSGVSFLVTGYESEALRSMISVERYLIFCTAMIFAFGITFEVPIILMALGKLGIVKAKMLARTRRYAILGIVVASALITPTPDVYNLMLLAVPMYIFYEIGIILVKILEKKNVC